MISKSKQFAWARACLVLFGVGASAWGPNAWGQVVPAPVDGQALEASAGKMAKKAQPTLDDLLDLTPKGGAKASGKDDKSRLAGSNMSAKQVGNLFERAVAEMERAADRLDRDKDAGLATQRVQQSVLAKLDQVISSAQRRRSRGGKGADGGLSQAPPKPRTSANISKPGQGDRESKAGKQPSSGSASPGMGGRAASSNPLLENRTEWGHLPVHLRAQLLQGLGETFSPLYQTMTEEYYRLLAEQESQP